MGLRGPKPKREEVVWSADVAYAVGLMASDGNLSPDGRHLFFVSKDLEQVSHIQRCFGVTANPSHQASGGYNKTRRYYRLQWGDVTLYNFLVAIGLTPRKSLTLGNVAVPDEYFFDFLRGQLDGDGCFYSYFDSRWRSSFMYYVVFSSGSYAHLDWIRSTIERLCGISGNITKGKREGAIYNLKFAKEKSRTILALIYPNPNVICLSRKRLKIERALGIVGQSLSNHS